MVFTQFAGAHAFMGSQDPLNESRAVVIPVPYEGTVSYGRGTSFGPSAIIDASRQVELFDLELKNEPIDIGIHTTDPIEPDAGSPKRTMERVRKLTYEMLEKNKFPVVLGGEHSISLGPVLSFLDLGKEFSVLQIDAHADLRESYGNSRYSHASVMARIRENTKNVVQVGIRSMDRSEHEYICEREIMGYIHGPSFDNDKILSQLKDDVYLTIDLDGFDPSEVPGVGTPEPGGIKWDQGLGLLRDVCKSKRVIGFDIVELSPIPGSIKSEFFAAKLAYKVLGYSFHNR